MARAWPLWTGLGSALLALSLLGSLASARSLSARAAAPAPDAAFAAATTASDLRLTLTLHGYSPSDRFSAPEGIAIDPRNRLLYIADTGKGRVIGFSLQGLPKFALKLTGVLAPRDMAVDEKGRVFIADKEAPTIVAVDSQGKTVLRIDLTGAGAMGAPRIRGLAIDHQGRLYIGDQASAQVLVCDTDGHVLSRIGVPGEQRGQLKMIEDVALDRAGRVYVVDSVGTSVNVFDPGGKFIFRFGRISPDTSNGYLRGPAAIALDRHDQLWVVDEEGHMLQVFDGRGFPLRSFGGDTVGATVTFLFPSAVAEDGLGHLYVAEKGADRVRVFALREPFLPFRQ